MSTINVTNLSGRNGSPNLPDGAVVTGVVTSTSAVIGSGVTINAGGLNVTGVLTATSFVGSGSGLTGVGETIAPWYYNPDVNDTQVTVGTGIGITFNKKVEAGSGTATLKIVNAGVAGTTIQSWGISSFTQAGVTELTLGSLVSSLTVDQTYQLDIPSGFVVDSNETSYAGTAYTFSVMAAQSKAFVWGSNSSGALGLNQAPGTLAAYSSPVQLGAASDNRWTTVISGYYASMGSKEDGTLYSWGFNDAGTLGQNTGGSNVRLSSPTQIPGTTWTSIGAIGRKPAAFSKTDGTLWTWGNNNTGVLGHNNVVQYSSPVQIPGTTWPKTLTNNNKQISFYRDSMAVIKTDGTLWTWGHNGRGLLGHNNTVQYSSPVQVPGTTWKHITCNMRAAHAIKTDGTLWSWGYNEYGDLGVNTGGPGAGGQHMSSPVQIPGTTWKHTASAGYGVIATRTDGTLWSWGLNGNTGRLGHNNQVSYSSPTQIPGTSWNLIGNTYQSFYATKTDGTLWAWGQNSNGMLGQNSEVLYSSPIQIGSESDWTTLTSSAYSYTAAALRTDETP
tara:strand:+ start:1 stop:1671 length:1671 start_codon:yes stop_codon:yes gene_type:complete